jgi:Uma2 family endonuclease
VLSPSTEDFDRQEKMPLYAHNGVPYAWLVDPIARTLEVYVLGANRKWKRPTIHRDDARVRVAPFDAIELNLAKLWAPAPSGKTPGHRPK